MARGRPFTVHTQRRGKPHPSWLSSTSTPPDHKVNARDPRLPLIPLRPFRRLLSRGRNLRHVGPVTPGRDPLPMGDLLLTLEGRLQIPPGSPFQREWLPGVPPPLHEGRKIER